LYEKDQFEFLKRNFSLKVWFTKSEDKVEETEKRKLEMCAEHLIKKLAKSISDKDRDFTDILLLTRLAEAFDK